MSIYLIEVILILKTIIKITFFFFNGLKGVHLIWQLVTFLSQQCQQISRGRILPVEPSGVGRFCCFKMLNLGTFIDLSERNQ